MKLDFKVKEYIIIYISNFIKYSNTGYEISVIIIFKINELNFISSQKLTFLF